jgi:hypothetical protein
MYHIDTTSTPKVGQLVSDSLLGQSFGRNEVRKNQTNQSCAAKIQEAWSDTNNPSDDRTNFCSADLLALNAFPGARLFISPLFKNLGQS